MSEVDYSDGWFGDTPFFLTHHSPDGNTGIDVDEPGWVEKHKDIFRAPGTWFLRRKPLAGDTSPPVFCVLIEEGEQFFFRKHHVGIVTVAREITVIGLGKKQRDGTPVNLWLFPNGVVCGGDDVDTVAIKMLS